VETTTAYVFTLRDGVTEDPSTMTVTISSDPNFTVTTDQLALAALNAVASIDPLTVEAERRYIGAEPFPEERA
jgi:hypothetical protein